MFDYKITPYEKGIKGQYSAKYLIFKLSKPCFCAQWGSWQWFMDVVVSISDMQHMTHDT